MTALTMNTRWCLALLVIGVGGCSGVLESNKPAREVYLLQAPAAAASSATPAVNDNLVLSVTAVPGLDTDRILVLGTDARLNPAANARWPDHMPEILTSITRRYLSATGRFASVQTGSIARPGDWFLELELQAFYGIQNHAGATTTVLLQWEGRLRCNDQTHILRLQETSPNSGVSLPGLVASHQQALDAALKRLPAAITDACGQGAPTDT